MKQLKIALIGDEKFMRLAKQQPDCMPYDLKYFTREYPRNGLTILNDKPDPLVKDMGLWLHNQAECQLVVMQTNIKSYEMLEFLRNSLQSDFKSKGFIYIYDDIDDPSLSGYHIHAAQLNMDAPNTIGYYPFEQVWKIHEKPNSYFPEDYFEYVKKNAANLTKEQQEDLNSYWRIPDKWESIIKRPRNYPESAGQNVNSLQNEDRPATSQSDLLNIDNINNQVGDNLGKDDADQLLQQIGVQEDKAVQNVTALEQKDTEAGKEPGSEPKAES